MTKRSKVQAGPFEHEWIETDGGDTHTIEELLEAASPQGRLRKWRPHADRLGVAGDLLDEAASLIGERGNVDNMDRFDYLLAQVQLEIERAQNHSAGVYDRAASHARHAAQLAGEARKRNQERRSKSERLNAHLVELDDQIKQSESGSRLNQERRAAKIQAEHKRELPESVLSMKPENLAKRIRDARK